jgi:hypothetical protein
MAWMACSVDVGGNSKSWRENLEDSKEESLRLYRMMRLIDMTAATRYICRPPLLLLSDSQPAMPVKVGWR